MSLDKCDYIEYYVNEILYLYKIIEWFAFIFMDYGNKAYRMLWMAGLQWLQWDSFINTSITYLTIYIPI